MKKVNILGNRIMIIIISLALCLLLPSLGFAQTEDSTITKLFRDSYYAIKSMRNANGVYIDALTVDTGVVDKPGCITANGIGLISLCIADSMYKKTGDSINWESDAESLVINTLSTLIAFKDSNRTNVKGFFPHWFDAESGKKAPGWGIEYSTIDNAIFAMGLIFCKNYFSSNISIAKKVDSLLMDFTAAISEDGRRLYMVLDSSGNRVEGTQKGPFNEYMIVAWLAKNVSPQNPGYTKSQLYWNIYYSDPKTDSIPKPIYWYYELLSDGGGFISHFISLFTYYYCHYFRNNDDYMEYFRNVRAADSLWWTKRYPGIDSYEWGLGAGEDPGGGSYSANAIDNNPRGIVSPHIIAGFIPVYPQSKNDLISLYNNVSPSVYSLPDDTSRKVLWRYSREDISLRCPYIQAVDFSTMLYGLASLPEYLGPNFFDTFNKIDTIFGNIETIDDSIHVDFRLEQNYPNPFKSATVIRYSLPHRCIVLLEIFNILGQHIQELVNSEQNAGYQEVTWHPNVSSGIYFYRIVAISTDNPSEQFVESKEMILLR
ncbi:MAG: T9SS type A sorting domain-containing protein [candidate division WOR-3 bacterium]